MTRKEKIEWLLNFAMASRRNGTTSHILCHPNPCQIIFEKQETAAMFELGNKEPIIIGQKFDLLTPMPIVLDNSTVITICEDALLEIKIREHESEVRKSVAIKMQQELDWAKTELAANNDIMIMNAETIREMSEELTYVKGEIGKHLDRILELTGEIAELKPSQ